MKQTIISAAFLLIAILMFNSNPFAQTVIDYEHWASSSGCNIFVTGTNNSNPVSVPATTGSTSTTIDHLSTIGQPEYDGTNKAVSLFCRAVVDAGGNTTAYKGTEYRITYTFKQSYTYSIKINAACINSNGTGTYATLRLLPNNGGSAVANACNGAADIDPNTSGGLYNGKSLIGGTAWQDYDFGWTPFSTQYSYLNLSAVPPIGSGNQTILIRKNHHY